MHVDLKTMLEKIVSENLLHARWLNTFSYLEYIGFRKIVKSQGAPAMDLETLTHAVEEGRHALRLKKLAIKIGGSSFAHYENTTLLCAEAAEHYFQTLDQICERSLMHIASAEARARRTYILVTWLVEVRAIAIYKEYGNALAKAGQSFPLTALIGEEEIHLAQVQTALKDFDEQAKSEIPHLVAKEEELYQEYLQILGNELHQIGRGPEVNSGIRAPVQERGVNPLEN